MALRSKIAIITGASSGIGAGIAEYFAKEGAKLSLTGRNKERLDAVAQKCQEITSEEVLQTVGDITEDITRQTLVQRTRKNFNKIDILVNNAGIGQATPLIEVTPQHYDDHMNINLRAPVLLTALVAPHLIESKGCVLNISSAVAKLSPHLIGVYSMTKTALNMYTMILARELGPQGVRVNSINSGYVFTPLFDKVSDQELVKELLDSVQQNTPIGRLGTKEEIAKIAAFLVSDSASFITGENLVADGGLCCSGASSGIGAGIAEYFAKEGAKLCLTVNNAGIAQSSSLIEVTPQHYDDHMNTNLRAPVLITALAAPHLIESKGCVLNISSAAAKLSPHFGGVYSMTKTALNMYTMVLARELGPHGVRVNSINSGHVLTPLFDKMPDKELVQERMERIQQLTPIGRHGSTEEVAKIAAFLVSNSVALITGENLVADGGILLMPGF